VNNRGPLFWSPDSASLYFTGSIGQQTGLCRVAAGGGDATMVQPGAVRGAISPDGRTLVTLAPSDDGKSFHLWIATPPEAPRRLYEPEPLQLAGFHNRPLLAFAPDGAKILLAINPDREETCWLLPWPPGKARRVFEKNMPITFTPQFSWMPDSRHVVFSAETEGTYSKSYMADTESGRYWPLMAQDRPAGAPSVSPDGSRVAYQSSLSHTDVIAAPLGDGPVQTLLGSSRSEQMAACSPTAQQVVYVTDRRGAPEVWITSLAEHWDRLLLSLGDLRVRDKPAQFFMTPVFSPDGRRVAVVAGPGTAIYTVFASGGSAVRATTETVSTERSPTWSPDGNWLAFCHSAESGSRLAKVRPGAGEPPVDLGACGASLPEWSPTGEWIATGDPSGGLTLVSPEGNGRRTLSGYGPVAWARDGKTVYQLRSELHSLVAIDVVTGKERTLRDLGELIPFSTLSPGLRASLTPDGKSIVYTVNRPREEIWILDGLQTPRPWYARLWGR
jgi:Tol biopolymer transport system component